MRNRITPSLTVPASAALFFLAACSNVSNSSLGVLPANGGPNAARIALPAAERLKAAKAGNVLYVTEVTSNAVARLQQNTWADLGPLQSQGAEGGWVDRNGNLYVTDVTNGTTNEYDPSGNLIFSYNKGFLETVIAVTTDRFGTVFVASQDSPNVVAEYPQGQAAPAINCYLPYGTVHGGIAVDKRGNVFVSAGQSILEFRHGLISSHCQTTPLSLAFQDAEGIVFDKQGNLVVSDYFANAVDIVAPPYASVTSTLGTTFNRPVSATINKAGTEAFVVESGLQQVRVVAYPSGSDIATLDSTYGISVPRFAIASKNFVP